MLASGPRGRRIKSYPYSCFSFSFPSDFYEIAAKSGTKTWDQNVGPESGSHFWSFFFVSLMIKYFPVALSFRNALMAKRTRHSPPEREEVRSIPAPSTLFFHISAPKGRNGDWIFLRRIGDYPLFFLQIKQSHIPFKKWD